MSHRARGSGLCSRIGTQISGTLIALGTVCSSANAGIPAEPRRYTGQLETGTVLHDSWTVIGSGALPFRQMRSQEREKLRFTPPQDAQLFQGHTFGANENPPLAQLQMDVMLLEATDGTAILYPDLNRDGIFSAEEGVTFVPILPGRAYDERELIRRGEKLPASHVKNPVYYDREAVFEAPLPAGGFLKSVTVGVPYIPGWQTKGGMLHQYIKLGYVRGKVDIEGQRLRVEYELDPLTGQTRLAGEDSFQGMDVNGDGKIDHGTGSPEYRANSAEGLPLVFQIGKRYLATESVDRVSGRIVLREHSATAFTARALSPGSVFPDFSFTDLDGRTRTLAEFKDKYVLLDFWGVWCAACKVELPHLKRAYERFRDHGLEIISLDSGDSVATLKAFVSAQQITWPQATAESVAGLIKDCSISAYPTTVLLNPAREVMKLGATDHEQQMALRGEKLLATLEQVLGPKGRQQSR